MAYLLLTNGKRQSISHDQGLKLWKSFVNPTNLSIEQTEFLSNVADVYLNWRDAPDDYIRSHLKEIVPLALSDWRTNTKGQPIKPATEQAWRFAKKFGLWEYGQPSYLVTNHAKLSF